MTIHKFTITLITMLSLTIGGCKLITPYRMDQQQGNVVTEKMLSQLHRGMSKGQVRHIMGNPVLVSTFDDDHWDYVYTFQHSHDPIHKKKISLVFRSNRLVHIEHDLPVWHDEQNDHHLRS